MPKKIPNKPLTPFEMFDASIGSLFPMLSDTMIRKKMWPIVRDLPTEAQNDFLEATLIAAAARKKL